MQTQTYWVKSMVIHQENGRAGSKTHDSDLTMACCTSWTPETLDLDERGLHQCPLIKEQTKVNGKS